MIAIVTVAVLSACGSPSPSTTIDTAAQPSVEEEVYEQVIRRYLTSPGENSFPEAFKLAYVLDQAHPDAGDPSPDKATPVPIPAETQSRITAALEPTTTVKFIADGKSVMDDKDGCAQVKDGGILITLGTLKGDDREVHVGINGYVACLGATWLTYVVHNPGGAGWTVKGTTGSMTVS